MVKKKYTHKNLSLVNMESMKYVTETKYGT